MSVLYCKHCGAKLDYVGHQPKFCSNCGSNLGYSAEAATAPPLQVPEETKAPIPNLFKLDYDLSFDGPGKITIGDVLQEELKNSPDGAPRPSEQVRGPVSEKEKNKSGEDILKESVARCQSSRQPEDVSE